MNKSYVVLFLMCATAIMQASEQNIERSQTECVPSPLTTWVGVHQTLKSDYKIYLHNRLEEYKKTDTEIVTINMDELVTMGSLMTGTTCAHKLNSTRDAEGNSFIHIAVEKADLPTVQWMCQDSRFRSITLTNNKSLLPLDLCIQKLTPCSIENQGDSVMHKILYALIEPSAKVCNTAYQTACLKKIAAVQLAHKKSNCDLAFTLELMRCLVPKENQAEAPSFLSTIYKETTDETDGNTFTHVLVEKECADDLFEWIQQGRVSFVKNKADLSPLDIALAQFRFFTQNVALIDGAKDSFEKRKCCLFMLLNYLKIKSGLAANAHFEQCCSKHIVGQ